MAKMHCKFSPKEAVILYAMALLYIMGRSVSQGLSLVETRALLQQAGFSSTFEDITKTLVKCLRTGRMRASDTGIVFVKNSPNDFVSLPIDVRIELQQHAMNLWVRKEEKQ
jgi:hypothetical protein